MIQRVSRPEGRLGEQGELGQGSKVVPAADG